MPGTTEFPPKVHFIPTDQQLTLIAQWYRELTEQPIRRRAFFGVPESMSANMGFIHAYNEDPRPRTFYARFGCFEEPGAKTEESPK
jgi:hypothetical protein